MEGIRKGGNPQNEATQEEGNPSKEGTTEGGNLQRIGSTKGLAKVETSNGGNPRKIY